MANYLSGQEKITTFPLWLKILLASVFFLLVIFFIFINMLRHQVKKKTAQLQKSEQLLQTLINAMPDFICFKDRDGRWLKVNDASIRIFQLEGIDYRGKKDSELAELNNKLLGTFLTCKNPTLKPGRMVALFMEKKGFLIPMVLYGSSMLRNCLFSIQMVNGKGLSLSDMISPSAKS